jgi:hypothetical protein
MVNHTDYKNYHIMKALRDDELTAREIQDRYNAALTWGNKPITSKSVAATIESKLLGRYVEVCGTFNPWSRHSTSRGANVYRATVEGRVWVERYTSHWGYIGESEWCWW